MFGHFRKCLVICANVGSFAQKTDHLHKCWVCRLNFYFNKFVNSIDRDSRTFSANLFWLKSWARKVFCIFQPCYATLLSSGVAVRSISSTLFKSFRIEQPGLWQESFSSLQPGQIEHTSWLDFYDSENSIYLFIVFSYLSVLYYL